MVNTKKYLLIGFGSVGQALLPAMIYSGIPAKSIHVLSADSDGSDVAAEFGIEVVRQPLDAHNYKAVLEKLQLNAGDMIINVSVEVSSVALMTWCKPKDVLYIDTCLEPWAGSYPDVSNFHLRTEAKFALQGKGPTAVICHGANPGIVTHLMIEGLLSLAKIKGVKEYFSYGDLAKKLGIKVVQIAENDTQDTIQKLPDDIFYNTWSVEGLKAECGQLAEIGWGSHEPLPEDLRVYLPDNQVMYLKDSGADTKVKSWTPLEGESEAYLLTHHESLTINEFLTYGDYSPTVYYAYNPARLTKQSIEKWRLSGDDAFTGSKVLKEELTSGVDELGVLFVFNGGAYWYGSTLSLEQARGQDENATYHPRTSFPHNSATSLQVVAGILGAIEWAMFHPASGLVEAEQMDSALILGSARPLLGKVHGVMTDWQPTHGGSLELGDFLIKPEIYSIDGKAHISDYQVATKMAGEMNFKFGD